MSDVFELCGMACFVVFAFLLWPPAAVAVAGLCLIIIGLALDGVSPPWRRRESDSSRR